MAPTHTEIVRHVLSLLGRYGPDPAVVSELERVVRRGAEPGDDPNAATRWASLATPAGNGDGSLGGAYGSNAPTDESRKFWLHLRTGEFVPGPT